MDKLSYFFLNGDVVHCYQTGKVRVFMSFTYHFQVDATLVSNEFIDRYLAEANGGICEGISVSAPPQRGTGES